MTTNVGVHGGAKRTPAVLLAELGNIPNILTLLRIAIIPVFVYFVGESDPVASTYSALIFAAAAITDVVDGFLARRWHLITVIGKFLDPLADKLIVNAAMVMLAYLGRVSPFVVIALISREFIVTGLRQVAATEGMVIAAGQEGKWKTALQLTGIIALCVHYTHPVSLLGLEYPVNFNLVGQVLLYSSVAFSFWSAGVYFRGFLQMLSQRAAT